MCVCVRMRVRVCVRVTKFTLLKITRGDCWELPEGLFSLCFWNSLFLWDWVSPSFPWCRVDAFHVGAFTCFFLYGPFLAGPFRAHAKQLQGKLHNVSSHPPPQRQKTNTPSSEPSGADPCSPPRCSPVMPPIRGGISRSLFFPTLYVACEPQRKAVGGGMYIFLKVI